MPPWTRGGQQMGVTPTWGEGFRGQSQVEGSGKLLQASTWEWSINPQIYRPTVKGLVPLDVRNPHPLTDPIHLPSLRRVETPVVHSDLPTGNFPIPTVITLASTTGVWIMGPYNLGSWCHKRGTAAQGAGIGPGIHRGLLSSSFHLDPSIPGQRDPKGLAHRTGSLLIQWLGSVTPELGICYRLISRGSDSLWCPGSGLWSLPLDVGSLVNNDKMRGDHESKMFQVLTR